MEGFLEPDRHLYHRGNPLDPTTAAVNMQPPLYNRYRLSMATDSSSPSPPSRPTSGRKGSKKVRTGCITCNYCLRCTKTGRKCDGYLDLKSMAPRRRSKDGDGSEPRSLGVLLDWASPEEKRSFHFFQHVTAPSLSGDLDAGFWKILVLQICQTEHAVRHAVLAVSSLHEGLLQGTVDPYVDGGASQSFALQQYNKAISRLLDQMNDAGSKPMASLLTCILFVCIEFMQSKDKESLIHLEQGRQILSQLERKANSDDPEIECIKEHLVPMYTRLSLTSFLFGGSPVPIPSGLKTVRHIPITFKSLAELRYCMYDFMDQGLRFTQRARPAKYGDSLSPEHIRALQNEQQHLLSQLAKLNVAFSLFRASKPTAAPEHHMHVLQMYLHAQQIWISTALSTSETAYDDHLASFAAIVPLAASFLEAEQSAPVRQPFQSRSVVPSFGVTPGFARSVQNSNAANFTFETHVIPPLYYVATKCRHPLIRKSALDLLRKNPERRENLWRANIMGSIAAHVVEVEERWAERSTPPTDFPPPPAAFTKDVNPQDIFTRGMSGPFGPDSFRSNMPSQEVASEVMFTINETPTTLFGEHLPASTATASIPELSVEDIDLDFDLPIDPALGMMDVEVSSSFSAAPSLSSSQDGASSISAVDPMMAFLAPQGLSNWLTQPVPPPAPAAALHIPPNPGFAERRDHSRASPSGSSDHSSEMDRYANKQSLEAPFDLPEPLRVHDAIIGPEKADGSWVTVFRKLHGSQADWDVLTEYVLV